MRHSGLVYFAAIDQLMVIVKLNRSSWQVQLVGISSPFEKLANEEDSYAFHTLIKTEILVICWLSPYSYPSCL